MTPNLNHKYIKEKEEDRIDAIITKMTTRQGIDHLVETETHHMEVEEILVEILGKIIEGDHETIIGMTVEETIIENKGIKIGVAIAIIAGIPIQIEKILGRTIHKVEILVEIEIGPDYHAPNLEERRDRDRSISRSESGSRSRLSSTVSTNRDRIRCYKYREYDHFAT